MTGSETIATTLQSHGWWIASRASGLVALVLVTISVTIGLLMAGKVMRRPGLSKKLMAVHEHTALVGLIAIAVHGISLLGDPWLNPGVAGVTVPFAIGFRPVFTGVGIIAGYLAGLLGLSYYFRKGIGAKRWRKAHRATVVVYLLGLVHAVGAGSDASAPWFRWWVLTTTPIVGSLFAYRMVAGRLRRRAQPAPASAQVALPAHSRPVRSPRIAPNPVGEEA